MGKVAPDNPGVGSLLASIGDVTPSKYAWLWVGAGGSLQGIPSLPMGPRMALA